MEIMDLEIESGAYESGKDCKTCSWHDMTIGNTCMCELMVSELQEVE